MLKFALTGGSCTGKTTLLNALEQAGHYCIPEASTLYRKLCRTIGETELSSRSPDYSNEVLKLCMEQESSIPTTSHLVFYDCTCIDQLAFCRYFGHTPSPRILEAADMLQLDMVFRLSFLKNAKTGKVLFENTFWRKSPFKRALKIQELTKEEYEKRGHTVIDVPPSSVENRLEIIYSSIEKLSER